MWEKKIGKGFAAALVVVLLATLTINGSEPDKKKDDGNQRARKLVEGLGNEGVRAVYGKDQADAHLVIPKDFNWDAHAKLRETIKELIDMGTTAFPELVAHVNDGRFSCFRANEVDRPTTVGRICEEMLRRQIDAYEYDLPAVKVSDERSWRDTVREPLALGVRRQDGRLGGGVVEEEQ